MKSNITLLRAVILSFALAVTAIPSTSVAVFAAFEVKAYDPPVYVTNLSGTVVDLQWQTVLPDRVLSPVRGGRIQPGATALRADEGLFWFADVAGGKSLKNVVFVSIVDANGAIVSQSVLDAEIAGVLGTVEATALHIVVEADGTLTLAAHSEK